MVQDEDLEKPLTKKMDKKAANQSLRYVSLVNNKLLINLKPFEKTENILCHWFIPIL